MMQVGRKLEISITQNRNDGKLDRRALPSFENRELLHCSPDIQVRPYNGPDRRERVGKSVEDLGRDEAQRWTTKRKAARQHGLTVTEIEDWKERFFLSAENALRARPKDDEALHEEQVKKLMQKIGDLVVDIDILREAAKRHPPMPGTPEQYSERSPEPQFSGSAACYRYAAALRLRYQRSPSDGSDFLPCWRSSCGF